MMDIDRQLQTHLDALMQMEKPEEFGPAFVQRHCRIGYNNACHVLERGVSSGLLIQGSAPYRYKLVDQPCWDCLVNRGEEPHDGVRMVIVSYIPLRQVLTALRPFVGDDEDESDPAICLVREMQKHDKRCGLNLSETIAVSYDHLWSVLDDLQKLELIGENNPARTLFDEAGRCAHHRVHSGIEGQGMAGKGEGLELLIISAPSGAGKTSLVAELLRRDARFGRPVTHTTRAPRSGEVEGVDYFFRTRESFLDMVGRGEFIEHAEVHGNLYGTSRSAVENVARQGKTAVLIIDWQGAAQIRRDMECISIFLMPPSLPELERRLVTRGQDSAEVIARRVRDAAEDIRHAGEFDHVVMNDDLDAAVGRVQAIVGKRRTGKNCYRPLR